MTREPPTCLRHEGHQHKGILHGTAQHPREPSPAHSLQGLALSKHVQRRERHRTRKTVTVWFWKEGANIQAKLSESTKGEKSWFTGRNSGINTGRYVPATDKFIVRIQCEFPALTARKLCLHRTQQGAQIGPNLRGLLASSWKHRVIDSQRKAESYASSSSPPNSS